MTVTSTPAFKSAMAVECRRQCGVTVFVESDGQMRVGCDGVFGDETLHRVTAEPAAGAGGEQRLAVATAAFSEPDSQDFHGGPGQRCAAVFATHCTCWSRAKRCTAALNRSLILAIGAVEAIGNPIC